MLKEQIKKIIYNGMALKEEEILKTIQQKNIVSFDVFDTLLKREVAAPEDVFEFVQHRLRKLGSPIKDYCYIRADAEKRARQIHPEREVTLSEIYSYTGYTFESQQELMQLELEAEKKLITGNVPIKRIYDRCVKDHKIIYFISDIYLPECFLTEILQENGFTEGKLYVSSKSGLTKRSGKLFSYIKEKEKIDEGTWVHIGDSIMADYVLPTKIGIDTVLVKRDISYNRYTDHVLYKKNKNYRQICHFIDVRIPHFTDPFEQIGYAVLGPLLYGFSQWLKNSVPEEETIVFLAREGAILKKAFEILSTRPTKYFCISRNAASVPYIASTDDVEKILEFKAHTLHNSYTQKELVKSCGLSEKKTCDIFSENHIEENTVVINAEQGRELLTKVLPYLKKTTQQQYTFLQHYIEQMNLSRKCALVDVGWHGTIQTLLEQTGYTFKGDKIHWKGYYMGILAEKNIKAYNDTEKRSLLFDEKKALKMRDTVRYSAPFFEMLFLSTQGSTERYELKSNGEIVPVFSEPENDDRLCSIINRLQNAGLQFVKDLNCSPLNIICFDGEISGANYQALARVPSQATLKLFQDFNAENGFRYKIAGEKSIGYYCQHPRDFIKDLKQTPGKSWMLKSIFKIPFPYIQMLSFIDRYRDPVITANRSANRG